MLSLMTIPDIHGLCLLEISLMHCLNFQKLCKELQNLMSMPIASIRSDHGREFDQLDFDSFCAKHGISHNFSASRTP